MRPSRRRPNSSSRMLEPLPASCSTRTSCPLTTSSRTPAGVMATRYSLSFSSRGTPTLIGGTLFQRPRASGQADLRLLGVPLTPVRQGRSDEVPEEGLGAVRPALELWMELPGDEPGVVGDLDDLHQGPVGGLAGADQAGVLELAPHAGIHLVAVPVTLVGQLRSVRGGRLRAGEELAGIGAQPHRAAEA